MIHHAQARIAGTSAAWQALALLLFCSLTALPAAQLVAANGVDAAEQRKAAEKAFTDIYGQDETTALRSREADDNLALAQKIWADARNAKLDAVLVEAMRDHAINLLTVLRTVDGCEQAIALRQEEMTLPGADRESIQSKIVELTATQSKYAPAGGEQMAAERKLMLAYAELAQIQLRKRAFSDAIRTLDRIRTLVSRYDPTAGQAIAGRTRLLQPLTQREMRLNKAQQNLAAKPDDKAGATEMVKLLVQDWGDIMSVAPYLPVADPAECRDVAALLAFEESGEDYTKLDSNALSTLADAYEFWAGDRQTQKYAQVLLLRKAAQARTQIVASAQGMDLLRAKRGLTETQDKLAALEKDQADLLSAIDGPLSLDGSIYLSRISGCDLAGVKAFEALPNTPRLDVQQMLQLSNGSFIAFAVSQGQGVPNGQEGWRVIVAPDAAGAWTQCPTILTRPTQRVQIFPDTDGKSFWLWVNRNNKITLNKWYYDAARKDVVKTGADLTGTLPNRYGDERGFYLGTDGSLLVFSGETFQNQQRWMIKPCLLKYDIRRFGDPVLNISTGGDNDTWRQRPMAVMINGIWHLYHQGGPSDEMRWSKLIDDKLVEIYRFQSKGNIQQLLPGRGSDLHFIWEQGGRWWLSTWNGRAMSEEKYFVNWQNGMQRNWVNVSAYGDSLVALIIRGVGGPQDANRKFQVSTMFRSGGNWSAEKVADASLTWPQTYGTWDPPGFRGNYCSMSLPMLLGDHDLKAVATFKVAP